MVRSVEERRQLSTIQDFKDNGFGQPPPRHGLRLLYWFATECVEFNQHGNMLLLFNPVEKDFGFHYFGNFEKILPDLKGRREHYFGVGNLTYPKAEELPNYVREYSQSQCNKDRIIIRQKQGNVQDVMAIYVIEHKQGGHLGEFDAKSTRLVNPDLIRMIRDAELEKFLDQTVRERLLKTFKQKMDVISLEFDSTHSKRSRPDQTTWDNSVRTLLDPEQDATMSPPGLSLRKRCSRSCKVFSVILVVSLVITLTVLAILGKL
ncbi:uncharacterized protein LOC115145839 isoform X1 [Oncorhynchus nerka]|uniref:uncharacterized protein LOC115145839 isoform X1 n=1 Tax=Oncorhynchus nerka TaxID=8023 RepID=UPI0031B7F363